MSGPQWPENGGEWSDGEDGTNMDCGLLQAMAEEDEEINVHNEETFGTGSFMSLVVSFCTLCAYGSVILCPQMGQTCLSSVVSFYVNFLISSSHN